MHVPISSLALKALVIPAATRHDIIVSLAVANGPTVWKAKGLLAQI